VATDDPVWRHNRRSEAAKGGSEGGDRARPHRSLGPNWSEPFWSLLKGRGLSKRLRTILVRAPTGTSPFAVWSAAQRPNQSGRKGPPVPVWETRPDQERETRQSPAALGRYTDATFKPNAGASNRRTTADAHWGSGDFHSLRPLRSSPLLGDEAGIGIAGRAERRPFPRREFP
jgi:hypothetical protein